MSTSESNHVVVPEIVDFSVLEASKENVQPLATGRRVTALSALLATPHAQREQKLSATRARLRINVQLALENAAAAAAAERSSDSPSSSSDDEREREQHDSDSDDPLEAYCSLVYWTLENYPQGHSAESGILETLEEATRVLKDEGGGRWRADQRYLKLWLLYAGYVEKPVVVYRFLIANEIGTGWGMLYEELGAVLERDGRRPEADAAYALGIARKAEPLDHLKARYEDFQKRMMSNMFLPPAAPAASSANPARPALATTASTTPLGASGSGSGSGQATARAASSRTTAAILGLPPSSASAQTNGRMQIFVDPSGAEAAAAEAAASTNEWNELGTRKTRVKENVPETKKMAGTKIKQAGKTKRLTSASSSGGGSGSKIAVFRDPGPETSGRVASSSKFVPFVDEPTPAAGSKSASAAPVAAAAAPSFTPFRDEDAAAPTPATLPIPDSVMRIKKVDTRASEPISEAEALRKDPLKNYGLGERGVEE